MLYCAYIERSAKCRMGGVQSRVVRVKAQYYATMGGAPCNKKKQDEIEKRGLYWLIRMTG